MTEPLPIDASDWNGDDADSTVETARGGGGLNSLTNLARERLIAMVEDARDSLVGQVRGLTSLTDLVVETFGGIAGGGIAGGVIGDRAAPVTRVVAEASGTINSIADALAEKSVEELVEDGRALVKAQPAAAVGLAIAVGFLAGRMLKAARD